jgi:hypothetical protein
MKRTLICLAALLTFGVAAQAGQNGPPLPLPGGGGHIVVPAEDRYAAYTANLPACDDPDVLNRIHDRFREKESEYWASSLQIAAYDRIREFSFRGNGLDYIPRRYCVARALLNDNHEHTVIYDIGEDLGMIGWGYGVEWCVVGLDRNLAFAPACTGLRPYAERFLGEEVLHTRY